MEIKKPAFRRLFLRSRCLKSYVCEAHCLAKYAIFSFDGKVEEMAADPVDGKPKDGVSCQITASGGYKAWVLA